MVDTIKVLAAKISPAFWTLEDGISEVLSLSLYMLIQMLFSSIFVNSLWLLHVQNIHLAFRN